ncbi:MAG: DUF1190 domain-containing protein [Alphaproteobacteria bacterium]|nr:DUF1190 domain-containing protein [Alphaproteobacteria bacterium]
MTYDPSSSAQVPPAPVQPPARRMSTGVKLAIMGVAGAALLYSCAPTVGSTVGGMPHLLFFGNPFYRGPIAAPVPEPPGSALTGRTGTSTSPTTSPGRVDAPPPSGTTTTQRGGFGSTAQSHSSSGGGAVSS